MMGQEVTSVDNGISECFVWIVNTDLGTNAPSKAFCTTCFHLVEVFEIIFDGVISMCRSDSFKALVPHLTIHYQTYSIMAMYYELVVVPYRQRRLYRI